MFLIYSAHLLIYLNTSRCVCLFLFYLLYLFSNSRAILEHKDIMKIQWNWKIGMCIEKGCVSEHWKNDNHLDLTRWCFHFLSLNFKQRSYYIVTNLFSVNFEVLSKDTRCAGLNMKIWVQILHFPYKSPTHLITNMFGLGTLQEHFSLVFPTWNTGRTGFVTHFDLNRTARY